MTRIEHLPSIVQKGLQCDAAVRAQGLLHTEIAHRHIKDRRAERMVPCGAGGSLAHYVPFYFAPRSPMLFAIMKGNVGPQVADQDALIYLLSSTQRLREAGLTVVASDRHPVLRIAVLSDVDADLDGDDFVDWALMDRQIWRDVPDYPDRKERRQAECLVHPRVGWDLIEQVAVRKESTARTVLGMLNDAAADTPVIVRPQWYF